MESATARWRVTLLSVTITTQIVESVRARNAVFVLGAGTTIGATGDSTCSWTGLIAEGIDMAADLNGRSNEWKQAQLELLNSADVTDLIDVAQTVTEELRRPAGNWYAKWLEATAGEYHNRIKSETLIRAIADLDAPIMTTNYDDVVESITGRTAVTYKDTSRVQAELNKPGKHVVHLHGHWTDPGGVVFGYQSYALAVGDQPSQAMMRALATTRQLIFIGFGGGLADPNFAALGTWLSSNVPQNSNAPIVITTDSSFASLERRGRAAGLSVATVGRDPDDVAVLLADVKRAASLSVDRPIVFEWDALQSKIPRLVRRVSREFNPNAILSMSGPGSVLAALALRLFDGDPPLFVAVTFPKKPMLSAAGDSFDEVARSAGWTTLETSRWLIHLPNALTHMPAGSRVLLLDDRVVGGNAQRLARETLTALGFEVKTAALVVHPDVQPQVDYSEETTAHDFTFPWGGKYGRNDPPVR